MAKLMKVLTLVLCLNLFSTGVFAVGELDTTFNSTGRNSISFGQPNTTLKDMAIQPDGKIVTVGDFSSGGSYIIAVVRLNTDGTLDTSFDGDGKLTVDIGGFGSCAASVAIQPAVRIWLLQPPMFRSAVEFQPPTVAALQKRVSVSRITAEIRETLSQTHSDIIISMNSNRAKHTFCKF